jgi:hypothetical protein
MDESDPLGGQSLNRSSSLVTVVPSNGPFVVQLSSPRSSPRTESAVTITPVSGRHRPGSAIHHHSVMIGAAATASRSRSSSQDSSINASSSSFNVIDDGANTATLCIRAPSSPRLEEGCSTSRRDNVVVPFVSAFSATRIVVGDHRASPASSMSSASSSRDRDEHHTGAATPLGSSVHDERQNNDCSSTQHVATFAVGHDDDDDDDDGTADHVKQTLDMSEFSSPLGDDVEFDDIYMTAPTLTTINHEDGRSIVVTAAAEAVPADSPRTTNYLCAVECHQHNETDGGHDDLFAASCDPLGGSGKREPTTPGSGAVNCHHLHVRHMLHDTSLFRSATPPRAEVTIDSFLSHCGTGAAVFDVAALSLQCASSSTEGQHPATSSTSSSTSDGGSSVERACRAFPPPPPRSINSHVSPRRVNSAAVTPVLVSSLSSQSESSCRCSELSLKNIVVGSSSGSSPVVAQHRVNRNFRSADRVGREHAVALSLSQRSEMDRQRVEKDEADVDSIARSSSVDTSLLTSSPQSLHAIHPLMGNNSTDDFVSTLATTTDSNSGSVTKAMRRVSFNISQ